MESHRCFNNSSDNNLGSNFKVQIQRAGPNGLEIIAKIVLDRE